MNSGAVGFKDDNDLSSSTVALPKAETLVMLPCGLLARLLLLP
jgi:hypothetical protein